MPAPKHRKQLTTWQVCRQVQRRFHSRESLVTVMGSACLLISYLERQVPPVVFTIIII